MFLFPCCSFHPPQCLASSRTLVTGDSNYLKAQKWTYFGEDFLKCSLEQNLFLDSLLGSRATYFLWLVRG